MDTTNAATLAQPIPEQYGESPDAVAIRRFWDRSMKLWTLYYLDDAGMQVGSAVYASNKLEAEAASATMASAPHYTESPDW